jgi:hypothetical protein
VRDDLARRLFPSIQPLDYRVAVKLALEKLEAREVETAEIDSPATTQRDATPVVARATHEGMIIERRQIAVDASPEAIFRAFTGLGGARGWLYMNWAWRIRGVFDRLFGGVGLRRGRRDPQFLCVGEALDFWRVETIDPGRMLRLRAEMKLPGKAWLQFEVKAQDRYPRPLLAQTAFFAPKGLLGLIYWYGLYPVHALIFRGMIQKLSELATRESQTTVLDERAADSFKL